MVNLLYNGISLISSVVVFLIGKFLPKRKHSEAILRVVSLFVFIFKTVQFVSENVKGNFYIPVEISAISYFLLTIIFIFKIKKLYGVGAFFGIMAGIGYFSFYTIAGFTVNDALSLKDVLIGVFMHGYLFVGGTYLFKKNKFEDSEKSKIWIAILAMLCWALVFYGFEMRTITFVYYIIQPEFLLVFENMGLNALLYGAYYTVIVFLFSLVVKVFFNLNRMFYKTEESRESREEISSAETEVG